MGFGKKVFNFLRGKGFQDEYSQVKDIDKIDDCATDLINTIESHMVGFETLFNDIQKREDTTSQNLRMLHRQVVTASTGAMNNSRVKERQELNKYLKKEAEDIHALEAELLKILDEHDTIMKSADTAIHVELADMTTDIKRAASKFLELLRNMDILLRGNNVGIGSDLFGTLKASADSMKRQTEQLIHNALELVQKDFDMHLNYPNLTVAQITQRLEDRKKAKQQLRGKALSLHNYMTKILGSLKEMFLLKLNAQLGPQRLSQKEVEESFRLPSGSPDNPGPSQQDLYTQLLDYLQKFEKHLVEFDAFFARRVNTANDIIISMRIVQARHLKEMKLLQDNVHAFYNNLMSSKDTKYEKTTEYGKIQSGLTDMLHRYDGSLHKKTDALGNIISSDDRLLVKEISELADEGKKVESATETFTGNMANLVVVDHTRRHKTFVAITAKAMVPILFINSIVYPAFQNTKVEQYADKSGHVLFVGDEDMFKAQFEEMRLRGDIEGYQTIDYADEATATIEFSIPADFRNDYSPEKKDLNLNDEIARQIELKNLEAKEQVEKKLRDKVMAFLRANKYKADKKVEQEIFEKISKYFMDDTDTLTVLQVTGKADMWGSGDYTIINASPNYKQYNLALAQKRPFTFKDDIEKTYITHGGLWSSRDSVSVQVIGAYVSTKNAAAAIGALNKWLSARGNVEYHKPNGETIRIKSIDIRKLQSSNDDVKSRELLNVDIVERVLVKENPQLFSQLKELTRSDRGVDVRAEKKVSKKMKLFVVKSIVAEKAVLQNHATVPVDRIITNNEARVSMKAQLIDRNPQRLYAGRSESHTQKRFAGNPGKAGYKNASGFKSAGGRYK